MEKTGRTNICEPAVSRPERDCHVPLTKVDLPIEERYVGNNLRMHDQVTWALAKIFVKPQKNIGRFEM
jgi:hypothetical protein